MAPSRWFIYLTTLKGQSHLAKNLLFVSLSNIIYKLWLKWLLQINKTTNFTFRLDFSIVGSPHCWTFVSNALEVFCSPFYFIFYDRKCCNNKFICLRHASLITIYQLLWPNKEILLLLRNTLIIDYHVYVDS